jgi:lysophospholipase L1-like esterase
MQWYESEVREVEIRNELLDIPRPVVFYGSSSIRLWTTLRKDLNMPEAANAAFGGSTLEACDYFFDRLVPPLNPRSLVLYAGDNDLGDGKMPAQVLKWFRSLAQKVQRISPALPFGYISIKPSPARFGIVERIRETNALIRAELEKNAFGFWIDIFEAMLDGEGNARPELFLEDGLHMNRSGYEIWMQKLSPFRSRMLIEEGLALQSGISQMVQPSPEP